MERVHTGKSCITGESVFSKQQMHDGTPQSGVGKGDTQVPVPALQLTFQKPLATSFGVVLKEHIYAVL